MKTRSRLISDAGMRKQARETASLARIAEAISSSLRFEDILGHVYESFRTLLPYERIGLALVTDAGRVVRSIGARSSARKLHLLPGYRAPLKGSSLAKILKTGKPRIINDLEEYLLAHPQSDSTRRIVAEGMRSSLTYPLSSQGKAVGFIFFSSKKPGTYSQEHIGSFRRVATLLSLSVEKGRLYEDLAAADEMKNRIMGIAAHDLRNPLTVVIGYLTLIQDAPGNDAYKSDVNIIQRKCKQMLSIIDSLLDSSIIESRGLELSPQRLDLREFLQQICVDSQILAEPKQIRLELELPSKLPVLMADRFRLLQTFDNLISNAIKYSMPKTTVTLSARVISGAVAITVADQGQGIAPEDFSLLFKDFGRTSAKPTAGERSIGLGLSIAQRVVKAHGGTIKVKSEQGEGTAFTVCLPLQAPSGGRVLFDVRR
ncbi:MAG: hypothetical protein A2506_01035 [Elusimicrobia bacterium RIFOXYD12_FULL_66_9]|nr:MAG: hypothetical protein A2506_01035 [Elusimicrobia bacterium RIFOXYD12_FULL_66_9]